MRFEVGDRVKVKEERFNLSFSDLCRSQIENLHSNREVIIEKIRGSRYYQVKGINCCCFPERYIDPCFPTRNC